MNRNSKRLGVFILIISAITLGAAVLRSIALLQDYDLNTGYFRSNVLISVASVVATIATLLAIVFALSMHKVSLRASFDSPHTYIPAGALGVSLVMLVFYLVRLTDIPSILGGESIGAESILAILCAALAILAIIHLFMTTLYTASQVTPRAYLAIGSVLFYAMLAALMYFDSTYAMNAHVKITDQMAVLFAAVFMLFEARISLGREKWRGYVGSGLIALSLTSYAAIPNLVVYFVRERTLSLSIEISIFLIVFSLFVLSRLLLTMRLGECAEGRSISAMREYAEARERALEAGETNEVSDDIQITIDDLFGEDLNPEATEDGVEAESETDGEGENETE